MKCFVIDAFTQNVFSGNPAAICVLENENVSDELMQSIAIEHNLSETAFIFAKSDKTYNIRWFTPKQEIDLCGHATLASAFVVMNFLNSKSDFVDFYTRKAGILKVKKDDKIYKMDFPKFPLTQIEVTSTMSEAVGQRVVEAYKGQDLVLVLENSVAVTRAKPDIKKVFDLEGILLHITALDETKRFDCVSRSFAPKHGVDEDPVCGRGHCHIAPLWSEKLNKKEILAHQASKRGGVLYCEVKDERVILGGEAVLYSQNEIML